MPPALILSLSKDEPVERFERPEPKRRAVRQDRGGREGSERLQLGFSIGTKGGAASSAS